MHDNPTRLRQVRLCVRAIRDSVFRPRDFRRLRSFRDYLGRSHAVLYVGFCGNNNLGDDIIFDVVQRYLYPLQLVNASPVLPVELRLAQLSRRNVAFLKHMVVGGGTLLNSSNYVDRCSRVLRAGGDVFIFGTGVRDPVYWARHLGQASMAAIAARWLSAINAAQLVTVRGPLSARMLNEMGVTREVEIVGDPALSTSLLTTSPPKEPGLIGLNIGSHRPSMVSFDELVQLLRQSMLDLLRRGYRLVFFALHPIDLECFFGLQREPWARGIELVKLFGSHRKEVARIAACELVISQRLHAAVVAHAYGVPAVAMVYDPKILDHMAAMGQEAWAVDPKRSSPAQLSETISSALAHSNTERAAISVRAAEYRRRQAEAARRIQTSILAARA
jgi:Polysaccharide pyruvyl transferase